MHDATLRLEDGIADAKDGEKNLEKENQ